MHINFVHKTKFHVKINDLHDYKIQLNINIIVPACRYCYNVRRLSRVMVGLRQNKGGGVIIVIYLDKKRLFNASRLYLRKNVILQYIFDNWRNHGQFLCNEKKKYKSTFSKLFVLIYPKLYLRFLFYMIKPEQKCEMNFTCHDRRKVE